MPQTNIALGDSYTIGESVDEQDRWPNQLVIPFVNTGWNSASPPSSLHRLENRRFEKGGDGSHLKNDYTISFSADRQWIINIRANRRINMPQNLKTYSKSLLPWRSKKRECVCGFDSRLSDNISFGNDLISNVSWSVFAINKTDRMNINEEWDSISFEFSKGVYPYRDRNHKHILFFSSGQVVAILSRSSNSVAYWSAGCLIWLFTPISRETNR